MQIECIFRKVLTKLLFSA